MDQTRKGTAIRFSVVIPTLNEEAAIGECLAHVGAADPNVEIVVVDGGSEDDTVQVARRAGVTVCWAKRGRGPQCNAGAAHASGDVLLFLHADTLLPRQAFTVLRDFFADDSVQIGTFRMSFDVSHPLLDLYARTTHVDSIATSFGDQCIVVRRSFFRTLGRFPDWPLFEDVHLLQRAREKTQVHSFPATVRTSARRFRENGTVRQILRDIWYVVQYLWGASPERIASKYDG